MKKLAKSVIGIMTVLAVCFGLAACSGGKTENGIETSLEAGTQTITKKAYAIFPGGIYVLEGVVTMESDKVMNCDISEINTMIFWGNVSRALTSEEAVMLGEDNIQSALARGHRGPEDARFAKYVQVGDVVFTANADSEGYISYTSDKTGDVVSYFDKSEDNIAWYVGQMYAGNYWLLKKAEDGYEKIDIASFYQDAAGSRLEKGESQNKKIRKHWEGWLPNIEKIESFFMKNGFIDGDFKKGEDGVWAVADAVSGATINQFEGYAGVLYEAYKK